MPDPTAPVLVAAFSSALILFIAAAVFQFVRMRKERLLIQEKIDPDAPVPPPLPAEYSGVPIWPYRWIDLAWGAIIFMTFASLSIANTQMDTTKVKLDAAVLIGSIGFQLTFAMLTGLVVFWRINLVEWLGLRWAKWPWVFLIAPGVVGGMWAVFALIQGLGYMEWMESLGVDAVQDTVRLLQKETDPAILGLMALAAVIIAPLCEEIVFRGYLYPVMKRFSGPWIAAICSGLIFAAAHGSLAALLPLAIFGFVLAVLYEKTGSIWAPMAVHFCFNGATVALQSLVRLFPHLLDQAK